MTKTKLFGLAAILAVAVWPAAMVRGQQVPVRPPEAEGQPPDRDPLNPAPDRRANEGLGPFKTLAIRGAMLIDGTGAPPQGPVDVIVQGNRISAIRSAGTPGLPLARQPSAAGRS